MIQVVLTPAEGKRLIGRAVAQMEVVQNALKEGIIVIATSTTTAFVVEELLKKKIENKGLFTAGVVTEKGCCLTDPKSRYMHQVIEKGKVTEMQTPDLPKVVAKMGPNDVFIKGANAIDPLGMAAIWLGGAGGGTIGTVWGYITSLGVKTIIAVGLEKLIPFSLTDMVPKMGIKTVDKSLGMAVGMMVVEGEVVTEVEAFNMLTSATAMPMGGGGINGAEGSKAFLIEGNDEVIKATYELVCGIKGEPSLRTKTQHCKMCDAKCDYKEK